MFEWVQQHWVEITAAVGGVVTAASLIVKLTPSKIDDEFFDKVVGVLNALALNPKRPA
jgi:hypothetical protein